MINDVHIVTATLPPRLLVHGQEGVGKTTPAAKFPTPVFLQLEDGTPAGLELASFGLLSSFADARGIASSPLGVALDLIASGATS
jgi:hypothetical protein